MPAVDPVRNTNVVRKRKIKRKPRSTAPPISGDQRDRMRAARDQQLRESVPKTPDQADRKRSPQQQAHDHAVVNRIVRETRERAVAKRNRGSGTRAVKRELEGHGVVAKTVGKLAGHVEHTTRGPVPRLRAQAFPGVSPTLAGRAVKDAVNLPAQAVPSLYVPAAGLVEAAQGRPQRLKKLAHDVSRNDPVYNLGAAAVEKARGHDRAARVHLDRAKKAASEHPGFTAAELYGVHGAAGRTAGATVRTAAKATGSKTLKRAGSTERAPRTLPGTNVQENRQYSRDLFRKTRQVVEDRNKRKVAGELRAQAKVEKDPDRRVELERQARAKDPTVLRDRDIARRVDEHVDAVEQVRRHHRTKVTAAVRKTVRKEAGPLPSLLAQRIVRADVGDVRAYIEELQAEHARMASPSKQRANEQLRHKLGKAVSGMESGRVNLPRAKAAADEYAAESRRGQAGLVKRGMLDAEQAERAAVIPYAVRRMGAKHDGDQLTLRRAVVRGGKRTVEDTPLSTAAIRNHMRQRGEEPAAFLSQAPNARGARNFYVNAAKPPKATGARRTGEATRQGTFDAHPDTLGEQAARTQGLTDAFDHFQQFIDEFGYRDPRGRGGIRTKRTKKDADQVARDLTANGDGVEWQAVRVNPFGASKEQLHAMLEGTEPHAPLHTALTKALAGDDGQGPWAIVPKAAADRMQEHVRVLNPGNAGRALRVVNSAFRKTVLATSLPWLAGNVTEAALRTALAKAGPRSYVTGRRVLKAASRVDPKMAELTAARTVGGGHFGFAERQHVHTNLDQFTDGVVKDVARPLSAFWKAPGPKHAAAVWNGWTHHVFQTVNKTVEQQFQTAMLGKAVRGSLMTDRLMKLSRKATDDAAKGILDRNTAAALGREIDIMYGKYGKFSPDMRKAVALYTPFAAWSLNAMTFVVKTLPRDHPVALAVTAAAVNATDEWRKEHGLDKFIAGAAPGWLQGSIPGAGGAKYRAPARYTPFGFFTDPLESIAGAVLPQFTGALAAFRGQDWKGATLRDRNGNELDDLGRARAAAKSFAEATVPLIAVAGRVRKKGAKSAILDATIGKVEPQKPPTGPSAPRVRRGSFGSSSYGSGSYGKSSYGGSSFK